MVIRLLKSLDNTGLIVDLESVIHDSVDVFCETDGVLVLTYAGFGEKRFKVKGGRARICEYEIPQGPGKMKYIAEDGTVFTLGKLTKNNRFLSVQNPTDELVAKLVIGLERERERADKLEEKVRSLGKEFGINVLEV